MTQKLNAIIIACLFFALNIKSEVSITGKITGKSASKIEYSVPINGVCYGGFKESTEIDSLGNFQITINTDKPAFVSIIIPGQFSDKMVIEPGYKYKVDINLLNNENIFKVLSPNEKAQDLYSNLPKPSFISMEFKKFNNDTTSTLLKTKIASLKANELSQFKKLLVSKEITQAFYNLVETDRNCYYSTILSGVLLSKFSRHFIEHPTEYPSEMYQLLNSVFTDYPLSKVDMINSSFWFDYAKNYITCKEYLNEDFKLQELKDIMKNGLINMHNIEESKKRLSEPMLEYYDAVYIYFTCVQKKYEKEMITIFDQFKAKYPNSGYIKFLKPMISPIVEFHQKTGLPKNPQIKFIDNYNKINSLEEAITLFKGTKIFIDVWATWCGPCKKEFIYNDSLHVQLKKKNIQIIYISVDREEQDNQWKDMANFYNLEGYHIRTNERFEADLRRIYNQNGQMTIPWYILINENGEIIKNHASRPSEIDKLEREINNN